MLDIKTSRPVSSTKTCKWIFGRIYLFCVGWKRAQEKHGLSFLERILQINLLLILKIRWFIDIYCCIVLKQMYVPQDLGLAYIFCWGNVNARKTYIVCPPSKLTVKDIESTPVLDKCFLKWIWLQSGCLHKYKYNEIQIRSIIGLWVVGTSGKWEALWPPGCEDTTS